jgi:hypothetical protein
MANLCALHREIAGLERSIIKFAAAIGSYRREPSNHRWEIDTSYPPFSHYHPHLVLAVGFGLLGWSTSLLENAHGPTISCNGSSLRRNLMVSEFTAFFKASVLNCPIHS